MYLIVRNLKAGKSKDSCSSTWYRIGGKVEGWKGGRVEELMKEYNYGILEKEVDIEKTLKKQGYTMEEIPFKNETDLQQNLQSVLQPKEVFLNTVFLMQDSDNIFQLTPADRLTVLKNVFNLLAIDEGKEVIADKKRELTYRLKATADTSKYDSKLQTLLNRYGDACTTLLEFKNYADIATIIDAKTYQEFLVDMELIKEKITITDFSLDSLPADLVAHLDERIARYKGQYITLQQSKQLIEKDYDKNKTSTQDSQQKIQTLEMQIKTIDTKISGLDPEKIEILKKEKIHVQAEQDAIEAKMPKKQFGVFYQKHSSELDFSLPEDIHVNELNFFTHSLVTFGKNIHEKIQNIDLQIKNQELHTQQQKTTLEQEVKNIVEKLKDMQEQQLRLKEKMTLFDQETEQQATFDCSKV